MKEISASPTVQSVLDKLNGVRRTGSGWQARCPCRNDDENPSLSIGEGNDGRALLNCHRGSGCNIVEICSAMNIKVTDLYPPRTPGGGGSYDKKLELVATYDYRDKSGRLIFQKQRFVDANGKKNFKQRRPDPAGGGKWIYSLDGIDKILYRLPQVDQAKRDGDVIWVVEGEKDADTLVRHGFCATTPPNGAGKWLDIHTEALAGGNIIVVSDNDEIGRAHASHVSQVLRDAGCTVTAFAPPAGFKDITELLDSGKTIDDLVDFHLAAPVGQEEEQQPIEAEQEPESGDRLQELSEKLTKILGRTELDESTRLIRASLLLTQFDAEDRYDRGRLVNWREFLNEPVNEEYDWVIPNLIERGERIMVVAAEGVGKTMLARQVAICSAAGIHPFTMERIKPITTLTIDLENPAKIIRRTSANIMGAAINYGHTKDVNAYLLIKPAGVDLMRQSDRSIIEEHVEKIKPDLILLGPVYKAFVDPGGRTSEAVAVEVAKYFDMLRDYYNCALWLEHHAPLGSSMSTRELRPFGSAVWSRWPEFGIALHPDATAVGEYLYDVRHFRGARDERMFPTKMRRGKVFPFEVVEFHNMKS